MDKKQSMKNNKHDKELIEELIGHLKDYYKDTPIKDTPDLSEVYRFAIKPLNQS